MNLNLGFILKVVLAIVFLAMCFLSIKKFIKDESGSRSYMETSNRYIPSFNICPYYQNYKTVTEFMLSNTQNYSIDVFENLPTLKDEIDIEMLDFEIYTAG